jgi:formylglycine-generating enzyme required for sulfatase activity
MKTRPTQILYATLSFVFILMMGEGNLKAQTAAANTLQHPKTQIALQLGAIQMGYTVPFTLTGNISAAKMQQAVNALVMGSNALDATVAKPAVHVVGAVDSPSVDTVEYRDQLYAAVEYVVTSPVVATIKGSATVTGNKKVMVFTKLTLPTNAWTIPVPYALESRSSADVQELANSQNALSSNFTILQTQTSSLSSNLTTVQGQVNGVSSNVTALSSNVTALQGQTGNLTSNVTALTSAQGDKLAALEATIQDLRAELADTGASKWGVMVTVQGGTLPQESELAGQTVDTFQIGKYEVTWGEWKAVRSWAVNNGYDIDGQGSASYSDEGEFQGFNQTSAKPVDNMTWHAAVKWCNAKSEMEGKTPFYTVNGTIYKTGFAVAPTASASANGYRLPTEKEWEWAARGGEKFYWLGFTYSGSYDDAVDSVAWTSENNSPIGPKAVGTKTPNPLGIYDMSGNLFEYCEDVATYPGYPTGRRYRGGSWLTSAEWAALANRGSVASDSSSNSFVGFRLARSSGN